MIGCGEPYVDTNARADPIARGAHAMRMPEEPRDANWQRDQLSS